MKLAESEEKVGEAIGKFAGLEKSKQRLQEELDDLLIEVDRANSSAGSMEKKQRNFDRFVKIIIE